MGARRKHSKQTRRERFRRWYRPLLLVMIVVAGWQLSGHLPEVVMPIDNVQIEGEFVHLSRLDVQKQLDQALTGDYFTADLAALRAALLKLPWVQDVTIRRRWPSTIEVGVVERQAVAYWSDDALLSDRGELFRPAAIDGNLSMPVIVGPDGLHQKVWQFLLTLQAKLTVLGLDVKKLVLDERRSWSMLLSKGVQIQLGRNETEKRIRRFVEVFSMRNAPNIDDIEYIDLRYPNGFALRNKPEHESDSSAGRRNIPEWNQHA